MGKNEYILYINKGCSSKQQYAFSYGHTKEITLSLAHNSALISVFLSRNYMDHFDESYLKSLLKEAMKRVELLHLLSYQESLQVRKLTLIIRSGQEMEKEYDLSDILIPYALFEGKLLRPINSEWSDPKVLEQVLRFQKSKDSMAREIAALYSYLFSKTQKKETLRFFYLWIAMNGVFACAYPGMGERDQMNRYVADQKLGSTVLSKRSRDSEGRKMIVQASRLSEPVTRESLERDENRYFSAYVDSLKNKYGNGNFDVTPYGFLLTDIPYFLRCNLFHASKPIELFSFIDDMELKVLRIVNALLEEHLDDHLCTFFQ